MGGNAFATSLGSASFPRMPPGVYVALKARLLPHLQTLYKYVEVPYEAPEKTSYGDLDFIVATPIINVDEDPARVSVAHGIVQKAIGAQYVNPMEGNRTSNFAIPIAKDEWSMFNHRGEEEQARQVVDGGDIFYQEGWLEVDVNVCADKAELDRVVFFHGYGDLGMIMGVVARNAGLQLGEKGLQLPNRPHPPIKLSHSFEDITQFMGWSMELWRAGFQTKLDVFEWVGSSALFKPEQFRAHGEGFSKVKADRKLYAEFVHWALEKGKTALPMPKDGASTDKERDFLEFRERVLVYFNKTEDADTIRQKHISSEFRKQTWNGTKVSDWTELGGNGRGVKLIMDSVREKLGGDEGVRRLYDQDGEGGVIKVVLEAKEQLTLASVISGHIPQ